jgi:hypothetical protein
MFMMTLIFWRVSSGLFSGRGFLGSAEKAMFGSFCLLRFLAGSSSAFSGS